MKLNWGANIAIVYIAFVILSVGTAVYFMNKDVDLVTEDYYEKEIAFQERINTIKRTEVLPGKVEFVYERDSAALTFPKIFPPNKISGEVHLYRPSDKKMDVVFPIELDSVSVMTVDLSKISDGYWRVKIEWNVESVNYFNEFKMYIQ